MYETGLKLFVYPFYGVSVFESYLMQKPKSLVEKRVPNLPKCMSPKVNVMAGMALEEPKSSH